MSVEKTKKVIRNFLLNGSPEVLSIKGDWGVGKTYFWKEAIKQAKGEPNFCRENYCYVSLFGITSVDQLKATIFETYERRSEIGNGFSWENLRNVCRDMEMPAQKLYPAF
ncbi:MAG: P-loop NTPase fold protein [Nitrospira sp.]